MLVVRIATTRHSVWRLVGDDQFRLRLSEDVMNTRIESQPELIRCHSVNRLVGLHVELFGEERIREILAGSGREARGAGGARR